MTLVDCGGVQLSVDRAGTGSPLVLVHGSWADRNTWEPVYAALARRFDTIRYDRRGYGDSQRPGVVMTQHVSDLLALVHAMNLDQVLLVANSFGGVVALGAALAAPERIAQVIVHEPPLFDLLDLNPSNHALAVKTHTARETMLKAARENAPIRAAQVFVENLAGAPGTWPYLPPEVQQGFIKHAAGFLGDADLSERIDLDLPVLRRLGSKLAVTRGSHSAMFLKVIAALLGNELRDARSHVFPNAGHVPHQTCPAEFTGTILNLVALYRP